MNACNRLCFDDRFAALNECVDGSCVVINEKASIKDSLHQRKLRMLSEIHALAIASHRVAYTILAVDMADKQTAPRLLIIRCGCVE